MSDSILRRTARALTLFALVAAGSVAADWELNMPRGVTDISNEVYDLHMLIFNICVVIAVSISIRTDESRNGKISPRVGTMRSKRLRNSDRC